MAQTLSRLWPRMNDCGTDTLVHPDAYGINCAGHTAQRAHNVIINWKITEAARGKCAYKNGVNVPVVQAWSYANFRHSAEPPPIPPKLHDASHAVMHLTSAHALN